MPSSDLLPFGCFSFPPYPFKTYQRQPSSCKLNLRYPDAGDVSFNRVISDFSVLLRETTLIISDSIETD